MKEKLNTKFELKKSTLPKSLGGPNKQNFYKFQNFQKFDNFLLLPNNSYLSYSSNSKSDFKNDSEKILQLFKKNVASYLILKRHFDSKKNFSKILHDFKLRNRGKLLNISETSSARKTDSFHYDPKNPLKNYTRELDESKMQPIMANDSPLYIKIDCQLKCEQSEIQSFPFQLNLNSLQKKFIQKHAAFLNNEKVASELLIARLVDQFNIVLLQIQEKRYGLSLPKYLKPMMEDFNDFYREKRKGEDEEELKQDENEKNSAMVLKTDIEDIFIDQILNNMESSLVEEKKEEEISQKKEEDNGEEEEEEEEESIDNKKSHKMLKKMEKYLQKKPSPSQNPHNVSTRNQQIETNNTHAEHENKVEPDRENSNIQNQEESKNEEKKEELQNFIPEVLNNSFEENRKNGINLENEDELFPPPQRDSSRMDLINKLLESHDLYNEDLSVLKKGLVYPQPPTDIKFVNDIEKEIFNKIFYWLYEIEIQVEKDKRDIEYYEKEYQRKFKDHYQKYQEMDEDDSIFDAESLEEVDEEESDISYEEENNEEENEEGKNE